MSIANLWSKASSALTSALHRAYDVDQDNVASAGLWKIYNARKKSSNQRVSVFVFEKRLLENPMHKSSSMRGVYEKIYEIMKKEASQLARLRHPSILEIVEPVEETRSVIVFATEPILASLSNLMGKYDYISNIPTELRKFELDELEMQKGFSQLGKAIEFCHQTGRLVHGNLQPDAIFVNLKGDWKLGGLGYCTYLNPPGGGKAEHDYPEYDTRIPGAVQRNFDYIAPEYVMDESVETANDMFSLGCLIYAVHNKGVTPFQTRQNLHSYRMNVEKLTSITYNQLPSHLQEVVYRLVTRYPSGRMTINEFMTSKYFDNILVSTIRFLETFPEKTKDEKTSFMKGLIRVLPQFPDRILMRKILPTLLEHTKDNTLSPFILPNVFHISSALSIEEFQSRVLPSLKPLFQIADPPQNLITLLEKMNLLREKTSSPVFKEDIMPLMYSALESNVPNVQEKALRMIPDIVEGLDYTTVKSSLFPRVLHLFAHTTILSVKVNTLICFHALMKTVDKFTIVEKLVPALKGIKTKEPAVMVATLAVYEEMGKVVDKEAIAEYILPHLWTLSMGPLLNFDQYKRFINVIHELGQRVEKEHSQHLQELKRVEDHTKSYTQNGNRETSHTTSGDAIFDFEKLVSGGGPVPNGNMEIAADPFGSLVGSNGHSASDSFANNGSAASLGISPSGSSGVVPTHRRTSTSTSTVMSPMKLGGVKGAFGATSNIDGWSFETTTSSGPKMETKIGGNLSSGMPPLSNSSIHNNNAPSLGIKNPALRPMTMVPALAPPPLTNTTVNTSGNISGISTINKTYNNPSIMPQMKPTTNVSATTMSSLPPLVPQTTSLGSLGTNGGSGSSAGFGMMQPLRPKSMNGPQQFISNMPKANNTQFYDFDPLK